MQIINEPKLDFCDVLMRPKRSSAGSRKDVNLIRNFQFPHSPKSLSCVPIFASNMDTTGSLAMGFALTEQRMLTCLHKFYKVDDLIAKNIHNDDNIWFSTGVSSRDLDRIEEYRDKSKGMNPNICIDIANGYSEFFVNKCLEVREKFPFSIIMAGNVCTPEMVEELIIHGKADIVKIGIGPGSVCTTRKQTGCGYPQFSAIIECADAAHGLKGHICSDGGCTTPGDVAKAFGGGADFVMLGGMFAGCDECEGSWQHEHEVYEMGNKIPYSIGSKKALAFHGMSSREAMIEHYGEVADYKAAEGKEVIVSYKGFAKDVAKEILGGLRGAGSTIGAMNIKDFPKCATFVVVNSGRTYNTIFGA